MIITTTAQIVRHIQQNKRHTQLKTDTAYSKHSRTDADSLVTVLLSLSAWNYLLRHRSSQVNRNISSNEQPAAAVQGANTLNCR